VSFDVNLDLLSTQRTDVINKNSSFKIKVEKLECKLLDVERNLQDFDLTTQNNVISKLLDRQTRARNIILFNFPNTSAFVPGLLDDISFVNDVFNTIGISVNPVSVHRLSKF